MYIIKVKEGLTFNRTIERETEEDLYNSYKYLIVNQNYEESQLEVKEVIGIDYNKEFKLRREIEIYKDNIIKDLKEVYPNTDYDIYYDEGNINVLHNNKCFVCSDSFFDECFNICKKYFSEETLWNINTSYDYVDYIKNKTK